MRLLLVAVTITNLLLSCSCCTILRLPSLFLWHWSRGLANVLCILKGHFIGNIGHFLSDKSWSSGGTLGTYIMAISIYTFTAILCSKFSFKPPFIMLFHSLHSIYRLWLFASNDNWFLHLGMHGEAIYTLVKLGSFFFFFFLRTAL